MPYNPKKNGAANYKSWSQLTEDQIAAIVAGEGADNTSDPNAERFAQVVLSANSKVNSNTGTVETSVNLEGHQCPYNNTTTPLGPDEEFIGSDWQDMLDYGVLSVNISTDVDSSEDGLVVEWSSDKVNIGNTDTFTLNGGQNKTFTFGPAERYYRLRYTNGPIAQTVFRLTAIIRRSYVKPSSHRISDSIVPDDDAELTKSVLTGLRPDGKFGNVNIAQHGTILVSNTPSRILISRVLPHLNDTYGANMNINAEFGGTPEPIHNGADNAYWTATSIGLGTWNFSSATQSHSGTYSISGENTQNGSIANIEDGGNLSGYTAITLWIYLTSFSENKNNEILLYFWENTGDSIVGNSIPISSYIDIDFLGSWQKATIPLSDMGITTESIDALRIEVVSDVPETQAPNFYLDDIQLEEAGGYIYDASPRPGTLFFVTSFRTTVEANVDIRLASAQALNLDPGKLFSLNSLDNGIVQIISQSGEIKFSSQIRTLADYLQIPNSEIKNVISTGTKTLLNIDTMLPEPFLLSEGDYSRIILSDDLSSLLKLRILAAGIEEELI